VYVSQSKTTATRRKIKEFIPVSGMGYCTKRGLWVSDTIWVAIIASVPLTVAAVATLVNSIMMHKQVATMNVRMNGRLDELLQLHRQQGRREGRMEEREDREERIGQLLFGVGGDTEQAIKKALPKEEGK
jgi:hypothetical protein